MSDLLERLTEHMNEHHETAIAGFTLYQLMAEHLLLHQYEHGIPPEGSPHDLDHHRASDERVPESEEPEMCPNCETPGKCNGPHLIGSVAIEGEGFGTLDIRRVPESEER